MYKPRDDLENDIHKILSDFEIQTGYPILARKSDLVLINHIYSAPSSRAGYDTRSIFKRSLTGLNLEFSFS